MDLRSDLPFWALRNGLIHTYPSLDSDVRCDVLVVGGGITGALVLHEFVRRGIDCVLVDRRHVAYGSTSASTGLLQYEIDTPLSVLIDLVGRKHAERAYKRGIEAISGLKHLAGNTTGFARRSSLFMARNQSHVARLKREFAARREAGLEVEWLTQTDLKRRGLHRPAAIRSEIGAEVDPYRLAHRLLKRSEKKGARIFDRTNIATFQHEKRRVAAKTDAGQRIICNKVVFATGYEVREILPAGLFDISSTYAWISEPLKDLDWWKERSLLWETGDAYLYARTTTDNRIIVGGGDNEIQNGQRRDALVTKKCIEVQTAFRRLLPRAAEAEPAFSWAGAFGHTKDGLPYIGPHAGFPNGLFALGFGGNGITFSQMAATILADLHQGRKNRDAELFRFER